MAAGWWKLGKRTPERSGPTKPTTTAVIFTVPASRLAAMDVALGPCVPVGGRKHALKSLHSQEGPETPEQMAALYRVLTGQDDSSALELLAESGPGQLFRCSPDFKSALVAADNELRSLAHNDEAAFHARRAELDRAWLATGVWHEEMVSTQNRLFRIGTVRAAEAKGQDLYCWYGPPVPEYVIASGTANELPEYLAEKRQPR